MKKRVLQSLASLNRGGAESMIMNLYRNIDRTKIQFDFVVNENQKKYVFENEIKKLGGNIYKVPKFNGKNILQYRKKWEQLFYKNKKWEILHIHNVSSGSLFTDIAAKYNIITISHSHFANSTKSFKSFIKKLFRFPLRYNTDYMLACSTEAGKYVFGKKNFSILPNSIETENFIYNQKTREIKRQELRLEDKFVIGHVGSFSFPKNHSYLIEVFNSYNKINPNSICLLVGTGPLDSKIYDKVKNYKLTEKVIFLGNRSDVNELLQVMDVLIFPSIYEGLPVTLIEAQAAGLPVIASDKITEEVKITELINFKSIEDSSDIWAEEIEKIKKIPRQDMYNEVVNAGYDVKKTAESLLNFYWSISE